MSQFTRAPRRALNTSVILAMAGSCPALAQVWDPVAQFSQSATPSGPWLYAQAANLAAPVIPLSTAPCGWQDPGGPNPGYPNIENCLSSGITMSPDSSGRLAVLRWTSPVAGPVRVSGSMAGYWNNTIVDGDLHIRHGQVELWSAMLRPAPFPPQPFDVSASVAPGETIDFLIGFGPNSSSEWDRVVLLAQIAQTACYANCDGSTAAPVLNVADFTCFLQKFAAGDPYANCDGSTAAPTLNVADFTCFLQRFAAGCP